MQVSFSYLFIYLVDCKKQFWSFSWWNICPWRLWFSRCRKWHISRILLPPQWNLCYGKKLCLLDLSEEPFHFISLLEFHFKTQMGVNLISRRMISVSYDFNNCEMSHLVFCILACVYWTTGVAKYIWWFPGKVGYNLGFAHLTIWRKSWRFQM